MPIRSLWAVVTVPCVLLMPSVAVANAAMPSLGLSLLSLYDVTILLLLIVALEAYVLVRVVLIPLRLAIITAFVANAFSTVVGAPVTWVLQIGSVLITRSLFPRVTIAVVDRMLHFILNPEWISSYPELGWMIPIMVFVLVVPYFLVSWFFEFLICKRLLRNWSAALVRRGVLFANLTSYTLMALVVFVRLLQVTN